MKPNSRIQQLIALSLLLVFTVQAGFGLWLHKALHRHVAKTAVYVESYSPIVQSGLVLFTCACIDSFLAPFVEAVNGIETAAPFQQYFNPAVAVYQSITCSEVQRFRPLRAPPALSV